MNKMEIRVTEVTVLPEGAALFDDRATVVCIVDEAAGEFVEVKQSSRAAGVAFDPGEWGAVRSAIDAMVSRCKQ